MCQRYGMGHVHMDLSQSVIKISKASGFHVVVSVHRIVGTRKFLSNKTQVRVK